MARPASTAEGRLRRARRALGFTAILALAGSPAAAAPPRERAVELIPELMGRILDSQEEIRETESEIAPVVQRHDAALVDAQERIEGAASEAEAAEALVDYVEAYASRLEAQEEGLRAIEAPIVRMRADARELRYAAQALGGDREAPEERQSYNQDQFQGIASGMQELAARLGREDEAATVGSVLHDSWAAQRAFGLPIPELGPEGAEAFARKIEGLFARHQARTHQLRAERRSVRHLLDLLIERQLARRLDSLFAGTDGLGLQDLFAAGGGSADWQDLSHVVGRVLGLPPGDGRSYARSGPALDQLEYFARGQHRD
jgi:hypothetical protein